MTKDYIKRQFSNFYNEVIKGKFAKREDVDNLNTDDISIKGATVVYDINHLSAFQSDKMTLENNVYTYNAPTKGNAWANYHIEDSDLAENNGVGTVKINTREVNGEWDVYFIYKRKSDGEIEFAKQSEYTITKAGETIINLDLNYLSVYKNYDGNGIDVVVSNGSRSTEEITYTIVIDEYNLVYGENSGLDGKNLSEVLLDLKDKAESKSNNTKTDSTSLATPNGDKYLLQVKNDGSLITIPKLPSNILYIGNSLLTGFGTHGMSSTTVNDDYYAKVNAYLDDKGKTLVTDKVSGGTFEGATSDNAVNTWITESLAPKMSSDRQLVIIQLGDNVNTAEKLAEFEKSCGMLCSYIREHCPNARVAWVGMWYSSNAKIEIIKNACDRYGVTFVDIHDLPTNAVNKNVIGATYIDAQGNEQTITESGVASHPSDTGFTAIANRIITTLFE